jgi:hypothetical protein
VTINGRRMEHFHSIDRIAELAMSHPEVAEVQKHNLQFDLSEFDETGRATRYHQSPWDLKLRLAATGATMYVGYTVNGARAGMANIWMRPGSGLQKKADREMARIVFYDIAEAEHKEPVLGGDYWRQAWETVAPMKSMGKSQCLLPILGRRCCYIVSLFDDNKCGLCGMGQSIGLKDSQSTWQWWCLTCAISFLEDRTHINIYAGRCSLVANNSDSFENERWSSPAYKDYEIENSYEEDPGSDPEVVGPEEGDEDEDDGSTQRPAGSAQVHPASRGEVAPSQPLRLQPPPATPPQFALAATAPVEVIGGEPSSPEIDGEPSQDASAPEVDEDGCSLCPASGGEMSVTTAAPETVKNEQVKQELPSDYDPDRDHGFPPVQNVPESLSTTTGQRCIHNRRPRGRGGRGSRGGGRKGR